MRTFVLDLDTRAVASDITPRNRLAGRRNLDFSPPALCHIVFRGDTVIDRYGANLALALASALNVRVARSLRRPLVALIHTVLNLHVGRSIIHRDADAMRPPVIDAHESLGRHVLELRARDGPACKRRARIVAHTLNIEQVVRIIRIGTGRIDCAHRAIRGIAINLVVATLHEGRPILSAVVVNLNSKTGRDSVSCPRVRTNRLAVDHGVCSVVIKLERESADLTQIKR